MKKNNKHNKSKDILIGDPDGKISKISGDVVVTLPLGGTLKFVGPVNIIPINGKALTVKYVK